MLGLRRHCGEELHGEGERALSSSSCSSAELRLPSWLVSPSSKSSSAWLKTFSCT